jgi:putative transposase
MAVHRQARCQPKTLNDAWSLDFVHDQLSCGAKIRLLTVIDVYSRECLAIDVGSRLRGEDVARILNRLVYLRGAPQALFADNGAEFTGQIVDLWAYHHKVRMDFSRPGTLTDNAYIESFKGSLRDGCLNINWFASLAEAKRLTEAWRRDDNESRPHMAHNGQSPSEFARKCRPMPWWQGQNRCWILTPSPDHQSQASQMFII